MKGKQTAGWRQQKNPPGIDGVWEVISNIRNLKKYRSIYEHEYLTAGALIYRARKQRSTETNKDKIVETQS